MAKSADAADLKSAGRKAVGVQVPLRAPEYPIFKRAQLAAEEKLAEMFHIGQEKAPL
jgi:hypothetical protein